MYLIFCAQYFRHISCNLYIVFKVLKLLLFIYDVSMSTMLHGKSACEHSNHMFVYKNI